MKKVAIGALAISTILVATSLVGCVNPKNKNSTDYNNTQVESTDDTIQTAYGPMPETVDNNSPNT